MNEWFSLRTRPCNLLLEGPKDVTEAALQLLTPHLREPILWRRPGAPLELPFDRHETLILQDVAALDANEQRRLLRWLDEIGQLTQVVSTTTIPLFPLVARKHFDSALYYRLNVMLLPVDTDTVFRQ